MLICFHAPLRHESGKAAKHNDGSGGGSVVLWCCGAVVVIALVVIVGVGGVGGSSGGVRETLQTLLPEKEIYICWEYI